MLGSQSLGGDADLWAALLPDIPGGADADGVESTASAGADAEPDAEPVTDDSSVSWAALETLWGQEDGTRAPETTGSTDEGTDAPASPLTWTDPAAALQQVESPNAGTMDVRRMKNREFMRRALERQREDFKRMKAAVHATECAPGEVMDT